MLWLRASSPTFELNPKKRRNPRTTRKTHQRRRRKHSSPQRQFRRKSRSPKKTPIHWRRQPAPHKGQHRQRTRRLRSLHVRTHRRKRPRRAPTRRNRLSPFRVRLPIQQQKKTVRKGAFIRRIVHKRRYDWYSLFLWRNDDCCLVDLHYYGEHSEGWDDGRGCVCGRRWYS